MLVARIDSKILKDQNEDKYVVNAEGFFDYVTGEKFETRCAAMGNKNPQSECDRKRDPSGAFERRFANGYRMGTAMENSKVQEQEECDGGVEGDPECQGAHLRYARILCGRQ